MALGNGCVTLISRRREGRWVAVGTTLFALLGTVFGLSVTVASSRTGDVVYHVTVLEMLAVTLGLLLLLPPSGRRSVPDR